MPGDYRVEGYAIVSADGMIADSSGWMPNSLMFESDKQFFSQALDRADAVVNGRHSHEGQPNSPLRKRLVLTRKIATLATDPENPRALLWNPAGAGFEEACRALGLASGTIAIVGGPETFTLFLETGYDAFFLCRSDSVSLPDGVPIFLQGKSGMSPDQLLSDFGLEPSASEALDERVQLVTWTRKAQS